MNESPVVVFDRLVAAGPPEQAQAAALFGTACVLGGSIAGLVAARVLADHAERVVIIERDAAAGAEWSRAGAPQARHANFLLPSGQGWMERWFPGFTREMRDGGAVIAAPGQSVIYRDGRRRVPGVHSRLLASRSFLENTVRARVLGLPNVRVLRAQATGLEYRGDQVSGVCYRSDLDEEVLAADFVVDAMGQASRLPDWLAADGFDRPALQRLPAAINYTTALFKRPQRAEDLPVNHSVVRYAPPYPADGVAVAVVGAIENDQWMVTLCGYDRVRPGRTLEAFRAVCAKLPLPFADVAGNDLAEDIAIYHQAESRRRDFAGLGYLPARLVSVGDAVASFNPIYGQGMSAAALHASCLSEYLSTDPDLSVQASRFFGREQAVTDAVWTVSAGGDAARLDGLNGAEVPEEISRQRWVMDQLLRASLVDADVSHAVENVTFMLAHPSTLADPGLLDRAIAATSSLAGSASLAIS